MPDARDDDLSLDDHILTCWCGASGTYDELFADECLEERCGGSGVLNCFCGGDICVCHNHGESDCTGCEDCEPEDLDDEDEDFYGDWSDDDAD